MRLCNIDCWIHIACVLAKKTPFLFVVSPPSFFSFFSMWWVHIHMFSFPANAPSKGTYRISLLRACKEQLVLWRRNVPQNPPCHLKGLWRSYGCTLQQNSRRRGQGSRVVRGPRPKSAWFFMKAPPLRRSVVLTVCYDSYNVGHPNWPPGKPFPTNSESESPQAPKYGAITVIGEASGDEDGGEMPE